MSMCAMLWAPCVSFVLTSPVCLPLYCIPADGVVPARPVSVHSFFVIGVRLPSTCYNPVLCRHCLPVAAVFQSLAYQCEGCPDVSAYYMRAMNSWSLVRRPPWKTLGCVPVGRP